MNYYNRAWTETNIDRARTNFLNIKAVVGDKKILAVVKANAYGHGAITLAKLYEQLGTDGFAVSNIGEALELRNAGITKDILILGYTPYLHAKELIENDIIQTVYSLEYAQELDNIAKEQGKKLRCHIKLDTGMSRLGFDCRNGLSEQTKNELLACKQLEGICIEGVFTHFATADSSQNEDTDFCNKQYDIFCNCVNSLLQEGFEFKLIHSDNSAATVTRKDEICNAVRPGIILYGYLPSNQLSSNIKLEPVLSVRSAVSMIKKIKKGDSVSYGRTFTAQSDITVATVPMGYADGYPRALSNKADVLVHGKRARIIGRVCMDQMMIDVTGFDDIQLGDTVTLIGRDKDEIITADELAELCGTISYEILCGFAPRVEKLYTEQ